MIELIQIAFISILAKILKFVFEIGTNFFVDKETYGSFALLLSYLFIYTKIASFGLQNILIREFPKYKSYNFKSFLLFNAVSIVILVAIVTYIVLNFFIPLPIEIFIIGISTALVILYSTYLRSIGKIKLWIYFQDINRYVFYLIGLTLLFLVCCHDISIDVILNLLAFSTLFSLILLLIVLKYKYNILLISKISLQKIQYLYQHSFPILFTGLTYLIISRVDIIMLANYVDIKIVGEYNIVSRITLQVLFFNQVVISYYYPKLSKMFAQKTDFMTISKYNLKFVLISFFSTVLMVFILFILINYYNFFDILGIKHQNKLYIVFIILAFTQIIYSAISFYGNILIYIHKQKIEYLNNVVILFIAIGLNILLIPNYGVVGAAIGTSIALIIGNIMQMIEVKLYTKTCFILK